LGVHVEDVRPALEAIYLFYLDFQQPRDRLFCDKPAQSVSGG